MSAPEPALHRRSVDSVVLGAEAMSACTPALNARRWRAVYPSETLMEPPARWHGRRRRLSA